MADSAGGSVAEAALPERLDRFMARANARYYGHRDPFHEFTTAPEITQVFGEILGLWAASVWEAMGSPAPVLLVEAGPGRATLMRDALRAIGKVAAPFAAALRLHLIETSPFLRALQERALPGGTWHDSWRDLPPGPMLLLANEFLDALPIRQFVRRADGWTERFVREGRFVELPAEAPALPFAAPRDSIVEVREEARALASYLGERFSREHGAALFLDYGPTRSSPGESLQALRAGHPADPLSEPGEADLSAHVDFAAFAARAVGARAEGPLPQGLFLTRLGLFRRIDRLTRGATPARAMALVTAGRRLVEPDAMGELFKALGLRHPSDPSLPGFSP